MFYDLLSQPFVRLSHPLTVTLLSKLPWNRWPTFCSLLAKPATFFAQSRAIHPTFSRRPPYKHTHIWANLLITKQTLNLFHFRLFGKLFFQLSPPSVCCFLSFEFQNANCVHLGCAPQGLARLLCRSDPGRDFCFCSLSTSL